MKRRPNWRGLLSVLLVFAISSSPLVRHTQAAPQRAGGGKGDENKGEENKDDPCTHLPDPPGKAKGIDKKCPAGGSSNGIAKGDFNGDGFADLAVAEPGATIGGQAGAGDVIILPGSANGLTATGQQIWYEGRVPGTGSPAAGDGFGTALASGDFNGDGYSDLAIGIPGRDVVFQGNTYQNWGRVLVMYGSPTGLTTDHTAIFDLSQHYFLRDGHAKEGALLGQALSWGDFNGDGAGDLAIGAPHYTLDRGLFNSQKSEAGAVWILYGIKKTSTAFGGLTAVSNLLFQADDLGGVIVDTDNSGPGDHFGAMLASGDFDGDTHFDLAIGSPDKTLACSFLFFCTPSPFPIVYALGGTSLGLALAIRFEGGLNDSLGALAVGDFNGDGKADLVWSAPTDHLAVAGEVFVCYGRNASTFMDFFACQAWDQHALGGVNQAGDHFGAALAVGDFNGDGKADLAIGVPFKDLVISGLTFVNAGEVDVIYGSSTGLALAHPPQRWNRTNAFNKADIDIASGDRFGAPLTAWNFGHDESFTVGLSTFPIRTADLAIGVPFETVNGVSGAGAVNVMYGSFYSNGLHSPDARFGITDSQVFSANSIGLGGQAGAHFGAGMY
jgi:hypothetical protein